MTRIKLVIESLLVALAAAAVGFAATVHADTDPPSPDPVVVASTPAQVVS